MLQIQYINLFLSPRYETYSVQLKDICLSRNRKAFACLNYIKGLCQRSKIEFFAEKLTAFSHLIFSQNVPS